MKHTTLLTALLLIAITAGAQRSHRQPLPDLTPERTVTPRNEIDPQKLQADAQELAALAQTIPADVAQLNHGLLAKDLSDKLKRIEKTAKKLRGAIAQP